MGSLGGPFSNPKVESGDAPSEQVVVPPRHSLPDCQAVVPSSVSLVSGSTAQTRQCGSGTTNISKTQDETFFSSNFEVIWGL